MVFVCVLVPPKTCAHIVTRVLLMLHRWAWDLILIAIISLATILLAAHHLILQLSLGFIFHRNLAHPCPSFLLAGEAAPCLRQSDWERLATVDCSSKYIPTQLHAEKPRGKLGVESVGYNTDTLGVMNTSRYVPLGPWPWSLYII